MLYKILLMSILFFAEFAVKFVPHAIFIFLKHDLVNFGFHDLMFIKFFKYKFRVDLNIIIFYNTILGPISYEKISLNVVFEEILICFS